MGWGFDNSVESGLKLSLAKVLFGEILLPKKPSIFKDIAHIGGGEVNPISKNLKEMIF